MVQCSCRLAVFELGDGDAEGFGKRSVEAECLEGNPKKQGDAIEAVMGT